MKAAPHRDAPNVIKDDHMPAEVKSKTEPWLAYAAFLALVVPALYVVGLGPAVRIATSIPDHGDIALWPYLPIFDFDDENPCKRALYWYAALWVNDGDGFVPLYSSDPSARARELIYTAEPAREIPEIWERLWLESQNTPDEEVPVEADQTKAGVI
jgi:hypothetical protein